jgi:nucleoside-diphosphate-sugar epimerase
MAEYAEMFYQHRIPQNVVSTDFETTFGARPTSLEEGIRKTLEWYRRFLSA